MSLPAKTPKRCEWPGDDKLMLKYHDLEWGVPCHNDKKLFEYVLLDTFQAGLSWRTILHKRKNFRKAFANFDAEKISHFNSRDVKRLMNDAGIIRNRQKIEATIKNAKAFLLTKKEFRTFDRYLWQFVGGKPIKNKWKLQSHLKAHSKESDAMSKDMKARGFGFVGTTICHAFMQGAGLINDHLVSCFRYKQVS